MSGAEDIEAAILTDGSTNPLAWFAGMTDHCYAFAEAAKARGRPIAGIMCEFTPREILLAAGVVPYLSPVLVALSLDGELRGLILAGEAAPAAPPAVSAAPRRRNRP